MTDIDEVFDNLVSSFVAPVRAPVLHHPAERGIDVESVCFLASDGVPLEGWFIPAKGSAKVIIANHPMGFSRSGLPTEQEPWQSIWAPSGNAVDVNLVNDYAILHEAGFNVLAYDLRNHGLSSAAHGGVIGSGWFEARDVLGSLRYVRQRPDTRHMSIGLFSRCMGCNATFAAMMQNPNAFQEVQCLSAPQPVSTPTILSHQLELAGVSQEHLPALDRRLTLRTSLSLSQRNARQWAAGVCVPTFLYQVHDDILTEPADIEAMYDNIPLRDKKLHWIDGSARRWDGYLEFARRPEPMLDWFNDHMKSSTGQAK